MYLSINCKQPINEECWWIGELDLANKRDVIAKFISLELCEAVKLQNNIDTISLITTNLYWPEYKYHLIEINVLEDYLEDLIKLKRDF